MGISFHPLARRVHMYEKLSTHIFPHPGPSQREQKELKSKKSEKYPR